MTNNNHERNPQKVKSHAEKEVLHEPKTSPTSSDARSNMDQSRPVNSSDHRYKPAEPMRVPEAGYEKDGTTMNDQRSDQRVKSGESETVPVSNANRAKRAFEAEN